MIAISSDVIRGYNDTMILHLLLQEPSYGYEISKRIRELSKEKYVIKDTTLYSAFTRMKMRAMGSAGHITGLRNRAEPIIWKNVRNGS